MSVAIPIIIIIISPTGQRERESGHMASNHTDTQNTQSDKDEPAKCRQDCAPDSSNKSRAGIGRDSSDAISQSVVNQ